MIGECERYCNCCNTIDIEDLYHFVIVCQHFANLRKIYITKYYYERPSVFKCLDLLQTQDKKQLRNTAYNQVVSKICYHTVVLYNYTSYLVL